MLTGWGLAVTGCACIERPVGYPYHRHEPARDAARVSPATIRRWCRLGHLTSFQVGRGAAIRIPAAELRALLQRLEDKSG